MKNQPPKKQSLPQPPPLPPSGATEEDNFKFFYGCAMIGCFSQFEVPKMENSDGLIVDGVTPSVEYYCNDAEEEADDNYQLWTERRSKVLSERCSMAAVDAIEQLNIFRLSKAINNGDSKS